VIATSQADSNKSATAIVNLLRHQVRLLRSLSIPVAALTSTLWEQLDCGTQALQGDKCQSTTRAMANTLDPALYQTERWVISSYQFSVPPGKYTVILKFAEIYWTSAGRRLFNTSINGTQVLTNFDIVAAQGQLSLRLINRSL